MSAEHRKPVVAFVALMLLAAVVISVQRADALSAGFTGLVAGLAPTHGEVPGGDAEDQRRLVPVAPGYFGHRGRPEEQPAGRRSGFEPTNRGGDAKRPAVSRHDSAPARVRGKATDLRRHRPGSPAADAPLADAERAASALVTRSPDTARPGGQGPESRWSGPAPRRLVGQGPRYGGVPRAR